MSKIKSGGLDQYGAAPFEQQQFGTAGSETVKFCCYRGRVYDFRKGQMPDSGQII